MNRKSGISYKFFIVIIALVAVIGYQVWQKFNTPAAHQMGMPVVKVLEVKPENIALSSEYPARIRASQEVEVKPRISAILLKKLYKEGDFIKKDTLLFELDKEQLSEELKKAEAIMKLAKHDLERIEKLYKQKVVSNSEYDKSLSNFQQAEAAYRLANISLEYTNIKSPLDGIAGVSEFSEEQP